MVLFGRRVTQRDLGGAGRVALPAALETASRAETDTAIVCLFQDVIHSFFWMGPNVPLRALFSVAAAAPGENTALLEERAIHAAAERCGKPAPISAGAFICTYTVNTHTEPSWLVSAADPARRVAMAYRVFQRDSTRERAEALLRAALASYQPAPGAAAAFQQIQDRPRRDAAAGAEREQRMLAWFDRQGWPPPRLEDTVRHGECAYRWSRRFQISLDTVCFAGSRPAGGELPDWLRAIQRDHLAAVVEYRFFPGRWQLVKPGQVLDFALEPWAALRQPAYDPARVYYFLLSERYLAYPGVADEADAEPRFLDDLLAAREKLAARLRP
jgi:hypothetical protein